MSAELIDPIQSHFPAPRLPTHIKKSKNKRVSYLENNRFIIVGDPLLFLCSENDIESTAWTKTMDYIKKKNSGKKNGEKLRVKSRAGQDFYLGWFSLVNDCSIVVHESTDLREMGA